ncbi:MAG: DoxX family protein [Calditrichaeota bacterium]|nr:DoxX family protein [Calditrichota bacterium]MCB0304549.1 DoxX family protein [Calditrichota bacterium]
MQFHNKQSTLSWLLRLVAAAILLQTLFFKFTGAEESVKIFSALGVEPWGRIGTGMMELLAAVLLLVPRTAAIGALFSLGVIGGALVSHLTVLGIFLEKVGVNDGGTLFFLAVVVFLASLSVLYLHRREIPVLGMRFQ